MRKITEESPHCWFVSSYKEEDGGAWITMNPTDGFFSIRYDIKWGRYARYTIPDDEQYPNWDAAYEMADRVMHSVENDLIIVD